MTGTARRPFVALGLPFLLLVLLQCAALSRNGWEVLYQHALFDGDTYMRLLRVERLLEGAGWYDGRSLRSNVPFGETLHWTRLMDLLIAAGAAPLRPFIGLREAVHWSGVAVSPLLHLACLPLLYWTAAPLFDREGRTYLGILFLFQMAVGGAFAAGRPDHHGLLALLFVATLGCALRLSLDGRQRWAVLSGLASAAGIWVGPEALVPPALVLLWSALDWVAGNRAAARRAALLAGSTALFLALLLPVEHPPARLLQVEYDRLSLLQPLLFLLAAAVAEAAHRLAPRGVAGRLLAATLLSAGAAGALHAVVPGALSGPMAAVDPRVEAVWFRSVAEVTSPLAGLGSGRSVRQLLVNLGMAPAGLAMLAWLALRGPPGQRRAWRLLGLFAVAYVGLTLWQLRWAAYAQLAGVPALTALLLAVLDRLGLRFAPPAAAGAGPLAVTTLGRLLVLLLFGGAGILAGGVAGRALGEGAPPHYCKARDIAPLLSAVPGLGERPRRILSFIFMGPELIYRTPHGVVATPYHRNRDGILDTLDFLGAADDGTARDIAARRGLDLVLICPLDEERGLYRGRPGAPSLFDRLVVGRPPEWLRPLPLPAGLTPEFKLYAVEP